MIWEYKVIETAIPLCGQRMWAYRNWELVSVVKEKRKFFDMYIYYFKRPA